MDKYLAAWKALDNVILHMGFSSSKDKDKVRMAMNLIELDFRIGRYEELLNKADIIKNGQLQHKM